MSDRKQINFRLSNDEFDFLKARSRERGISISALVRNEVLNSIKNKKIKQPKFNADDTKLLLKSIIPMSNNLNQIAKSLNQNKNPNNQKNSEVLHDELKAIRKAVLEICQRLK